MATDLDVISNLTGAGVTEAQAKTWLTAMRAALAEMGDPLGKFASIQNLTLAATVAANALTIALKDRDGSDPSAASPCSAPFRNATLATGDFSVLNAIAATSLVVPDTALLGTVNTIPFRLWVVLFNDAGTLRLGVVNCLSGSSIMTLREDLRYSSTTVGTGSDAAQVIYSGTGVTTKAMRILGYLEWSSGLATAGTWSSAPTKIQLMGPGVCLPGHVVQIAQNVDGAVATGTTPVVNDDTIPQNTEGDQYMSQAISPASPANLLHVHASLNITHSDASGVNITAIFQDAVANALAARAHFLGSASATPHPIDVEHWMVANSSSITFKARSGNGSAGTSTFNGNGGARKLGGVIPSRMKVTEYMT